MSIGLKMVEIMQACRTIGKDATNPTQGYKYTSAASVVTKINAELTARGLYTQCITDLITLREVTVAAGHNENIAAVKATIIITDVETGEQVKFAGVGSGQDAGDKCVMKATTAAIKYAYIGGLCMAMTDDPEADINTRAYHKTTAPTREPNPAGMNNVAGKCDKCGAPISQSAIDYSRKYFGRRLCHKCQQSIKSTVA